MQTRRRAVAGALSVLLVGAGLLGLSAPAQADGDPVIFGSITDARTHAPIKNVRVLLFDSAYAYVRDTKVASNGVYTIPSPGAGDFRLQFVDARPAYDTRSYAARLDVPVSVDESGSAEKSVTMRRGGAVGGTVRAKGKRVRNATVRALSDHGHVVSVTSNTKGQYALGGLTNDNYRVFAYDSKKNWVGKSRLVRKISSGAYKTASFDLRTRASSFTGGFLKTGGTPATGSVTVTAVNTRTGEYWVQKITNGGLNLRGLTAGRYELKVPTFRGYFGKTFDLGSLRTGQHRNASVDLPVRSGRLIGKVVNKNTGVPIKNASVRLLDGNGKTQSELTTASDGTFVIGDGLTAQTNMTVKVFTYDKIDGVMYVSQELTGKVIADGVTVDLGTIQLVPETTTPPTTTTPPPPAP